MIKNNQIKEALYFIDKDKRNILSLVKKIANIPSPTFHEKEKISFLQKFVLSLGYKASIDEAGNLCGEIKGFEKSPTVLVVAHTDTVLKPDKKAEQDNKYFYGHGVCDNSTGLVALLIILKLIKELNLKLRGRLVFAFTVCEEGLGFKKGMQFLMRSNKDVDAVINLESHNLGRIINQSPGQFRTKISLENKKNGHSFRNFGNPNPIIILSQIITDFAKLPGFKKHETTFNIGTIIGGEKINSIPKNAEMLLEIRSLKQKKLEFFKKSLRKLLKQHTKIKITQKIFTDTQAAFFPKTHKIYKLVQKVHSNMGIKSFFEAGNNDGDIPLILRIPTVTIGSSIGYKTHSQYEYVDKESIVLGIKQDFLIILEIMQNLL